MNNDIFQFFFNLSEIPFIGNLALFLSYPFTYGLLLLIIIWAIFISKNIFFNFSLFFITSFFSWLISTIFKNIFGISRPFIDGSIVPLFRESGYSFPSDHMSVFTAIAVVMFLVNRKAGFVFVLIAILIGLSRIVIGVHYPADILGGLVVGLVVGLIFTKIYKKI